MFVLVPVLSELFDLELNEQVQEMVTKRQMPTVEYKEIKIHDYSKLPVFASWASTERKCSYLY